MTELFKCPYQDEGVVEWTDVEGCESTCFGEGCSKIKSCDAYKHFKHKEEEKYK